VQRRPLLGAFVLAADMAAVGAVMHIKSVSNSSYPRERIARFLTRTAGALFAVAMWEGWRFHTAASEASQVDAASRLVTFLGLSLFAWAGSEHARGEVLVYRRRASRSRQPAMYWTVLVVFRLLVGASLLAAGIAS
jgi:hypothetical protein